MDCLSLSIPHLVVSSKETIEKTLELHILTPFGHVDISFSALPLWRAGRPCLDILVEGDTASWMLGRGLPQAFRNTIIEFVGGVALRHSGWPTGSPCELHIRFPQETGDIRLAGCLMSCVSAISDG